MVNDIQEILTNSEVIIINNKEKEYAEVFSNWTGEAQIIDMVRIDKTLPEKATYQGINW